MSFFDISQHSKENSVGVVIYSYNFYCYIGCMAMESTSLINYIQTVHLSL